MGGNVKKRINDILRVAAPGDRASWVFDIFIMTLISLNVIAVILGSVKSLSASYGAFFRGFEIFSVVIFTVEYILRVWTCTTVNKYRNPVTGRIRYMITPLAIIDLLAILPFYIPMVIPCDLRFLRAIRLIRLLRLLKMGRYPESIKVLGAVFRKKKEEIFVTVIAVIILLVCASSLMYMAETEAQPEAFADIPSAMWWGISTLTTVGYGDVYPITTVGKILGAIISLLGIGLFALPAGIFASGLVEAIREKRDKFLCPHCGKEINNTSFQKSIHI